MRIADLARRMFRCAVSAPLPNPAHKFRFRPSLHPLKDRTVPTPVVRVDRLDDAAEHNTVVGHPQGNKRYYWMTLANFKRDFINVAIEK